METKGRIESSACVAQQTEEAVQDLTLRAVEGSTGPGRENISWNLASFTGNKSSDICVEANKPYACPIMIFRSLQPGHFCKINFEVTKSIPYLASLDACLTKSFANGSTSPATATANLRDSAQKCNKCQHTRLLPKHFKYFNANWTWAAA